MLTFKAERREIFGKKLKTARAAGSLPVIVYGPKEKPSSWFIPLGDFKKALRGAGGSTLVSLETPSGKKDVLLQEVAYHPVSGEPLHADFLVIDRAKLIKVKVPLQFVGAAPAVKDLGGTLVKVMHEVEIETLPMDIPPGLEVDLSALTALESQILVKDIKVPANVKVLAESEAVIASLTVVEEEPIGEAPADLTQIEVEKKGKKEEESEAGAAGGEAARTA